MPELSASGIPTGVVLFATTSSPPVSLGQGRLEQATVVVGDAALAAAIGSTDPQLLLVVTWPRNGEGAGAAEVLPVIDVARRTGMVDEHVEHPDVVVAIELGAESDAIASPLEPSKGKQLICVLFPNLKRCKK